MEELFDEVYVGEDHTPAAVALEGQSVEGLSARGDDAGRGGAGQRAGLTDTRVQMYAYPSLWPASRSWR